MSKYQLIISIVVLAISVQITRWLPFVVFKNSEKIPKIITVLGNFLPAAMMGLLVVYCFKDYNLLSFSQMAPALISVAAIVGVHLWRKNTILSITLGTVLYMVLIRVM